MRKPSFFVATGFSLFVLCSCNLSVSSRPHTTDASQSEANVEKVAMRIGTFDYHVDYKGHSLQASLRDGSGAILQQMTLEDIPLLQNVRGDSPGTAPVQYSHPSGLILYQVINREEEGGAKVDSSFPYCRMIFATDFNAKAPALVFGDEDCGLEWLNAGQFIIHPSRPLMLVTMPVEETLQLRVIDLRSLETVAAFSVSSPGAFRISPNGRFAYQYSSGEIAFDQERGKLTIINLDTYVFEQKTFGIPKLDIEDKARKYSSTENISPDLRYMAYPFGAYELSPLGLNMDFNNFGEFKGYESSNYNVPWSLDGRYIFFQATKDKNDVGIIYDTQLRKMVHTSIVTFSFEQIKPILHQYQIYYLDQPVVLSE